MSIRSTHEWSISTTDSFTLVELHSFVTRLRESGVGAEVPVTVRVSPGDRPFDSGTTTLSCTATTEGADS